MIPSITLRPSALKKLRWCSFNSLFNVAGDAAQTRAQRRFELASIWLVGTYSSFTIFFDIHSPIKKRTAPSPDLFQTVWSPEEIGQNYREMRKNEPYEYHSLIRSCFFEKPIVRFSDGSLVVPHTHLLFLHAGQGLYRLAHGIEEFAESLSRSFEAYVKKVLEGLEGARRIIATKALKKAASGKSCDFLVETKATVILVECKACAFTAKRLHDEAIRESNSTGKVAKGLTQLYSTAKDLENGRFAALGVNKAKPTIGVVVTFGEIPSANSEWYFEEFFLKKAEGKLREGIYPSKQMGRRPIVLDITSFEKLVVVLNSEGNTLQALYDDWNSKGYHATGDWGIWLASRHRNGDPKLLDFLEELRSMFLSDFGMDSGQAEFDKDLRIGRIARVVSDSPT